MLIIDLEFGEFLRIGDQIKIGFIKNNFNKKNSQVRCGIHAPDNIKVWRKEIYDKIQQQNEETPL